MLEFRISGETAEVGCLADQLERAGLSSGARSPIATGTRKVVGSISNWMRTRSWAGCLPTLKSIPRRPHTMPAFRLRRKAGPSTETHRLERDRLNRAK